MEVMKKLIEIRTFCGKVETVGLEDKFIEQFLTEDERLVEVIEQAWVEHMDLRVLFGEILSLDEKDQLRINK